MDVQEAVKDVVPKYRSNPLSDFDNGVGLDLRVKIAAELLKSPMFTVSINAREDALRALETACALMDLAAERGLVYAIPDHDEISPQLRRHISRNAKAAVHQHMAQQRAAREESGGVMPVGASAYPGGNG